MISNEFISDVVNAVENLIPEEIRDEMSVEVKEIVKDNDRLLHGVIIRSPEQHVVPTIYLEDCLTEMPDEVSIEEIADGIISTYIRGMKEAPDIDEVSFEFDNIKDKLQVQVIEASRNMDRLKDLVYKPLDNGMVMTVYAVMQENEEGQLRAVLTKDAVKGFGYDIDKLFDAAMQNSIEKNAPMISDMMSMVLQMGSREDCNPLSENFALNTGEDMYVLTNVNANYGAVVLYYPDVMKNIGEAIMDNYYVLPSSQHEVIIVPESSSIDLGTLQAMVKDANRTVVDPKDVLTDKVMKYDRETDRLIETKPVERNGEERGER